MCKLKINNLVELNSKRQQEEESSAKKAVAKECLKEKNDIIRKENQNKYCK
jgi:hypothetical protein